MVRDRELSRIAAPANEAELLLDFGRLVRWKMRRGATVELASEQLKAPLDYCHLAFAFANASDLLKLRAMVEDWPLARIAVEVGAPIVQQHPNVQSIRKALDSQVTQPRPCGAWT